MNSIQSISSRKKIIQILTICIVFVVLIFFPRFLGNINSSIENSFKKFDGEKTADSNIVLIKIDQNDINMLGWPLKRNYYALLINKLKKLNVAVIGFEIFLSPSSSYQSIYDDLLNNQIKKAGNVVLSSLAINIHLKDKKAFADSIIYPEPKFFVPKPFVDKIVTGHLNYFNLTGIIIPNTIENGSKNEPSFSKAVAALYNPSLNIPSKLKVNQLHSWHDFKSYSLLEFFNLVENNSSILKQFKNKIVLIGVSDPTIAKTVKATFNNNMPGIGLNATAVENLLDSTYLRTNFILPSAFIFFLIVFLFVLFMKETKKILSYSILLVLILGIGFLLLTQFYIELDYRIFIAIYLILTIIEVLFFLLERKKLLKKSLSESDILRKMLASKETQLQQLEKKIDVAAESAHLDLTDKIASLKQEINSLKNSQLDNEPVKNENTDEKVKNFFGIVYKSKKMGQLIEVIKKVAPEDATVLILGESGSGKELVAKAIHKLSKRKDGNFVALNCAALTDSLLESELFGHLKGAFTNAITTKKGLFEAANNGTIFLDEIGETSENFQAKLLRVLQSGEYQKVGSTVTETTNARIVAATNKNLNELVAEKKFREDLFYRLNVISVELPPLRERKEDIPAIAEYFAKLENDKLKISKAVMLQLEQNEWQGNIRQLESIIKRASIFAKSEKRDIIKLIDLPEDMVKLDKSNLESLILNSLREKNFTHSSINETAKELGVSRTVISENFRGIFFKNLVEAKFDKSIAIKKIVASGSKETEEKVAAKVELYLKNIQKDLNGKSNMSYDKIKSSFVSKYKNLPQKYHKYLDTIIKYLIEKTWNN